MHIMFCGKKVQQKITFLKQTGNVNLENFLKLLKVCTIKRSVQKWKKSSYKNCLNMKHTITWMDTIYEKNIQSGYSDIS